MLSNTRLAASMALRGMLKSSPLPPATDPRSQQPNQHLLSFLFEQVLQHFFRRQHQNLPLQRSPHHAMHKARRLASLANPEEKFLCRVKKRRRVPCNMPCISLKSCLQLEGMANGLPLSERPWIKLPIGPVKAPCGL